MKKTAFSNYDTTLQALYNRLPAYQRQGKKAFKKDLTNIRRLCKALEQPQDRFKSIHIAGTNGKGSVAHILAGIYQAAGYRTGLYTSPHYMDFRERIKVDGQLCSKRFVVRFMQRIEPLLSQFSPSFFEVTVAMAFTYFNEVNVDIAIIETGLGGRLDSTNIILPKLSVITNIDFDHMDMLGNTLPQIAGEKAGIIKPNTPVVIGEYQAETFPVFTEKAELEHAPIYRADESVALTNVEERVDGLRFTYQNEVISTDISGGYQAKNIRTALAAVDVVKDIWPITLPAIKEGLDNLRKRTYFLGRWMILQKQPLCIADSAHNAKGLSYVVDQLKKMEYAKLHIVLGMVREKDRSSIWSMLPQKATYYFCNAQIDRALPAEELRTEAEEQGFTGASFTSTASAMAEAQRCAQPDDLILITGSVFVVAEALAKTQRETEG